MWYILDCDEDSYLYYGFNEEISKEELLDTKGNLERLVMILQSKQKEEKRSKQCRTFLER